MDAERQLAIEEATIKRYAEQRRFAVASENVLGIGQIVDNTLWISASADMSCAIWIVTAEAAMSDLAEQFLAVGFETEEWEAWEDMYSAAFNHFYWIVALD